MELYLALYSGLLIMETRFRNYNLRIICKKIRRLIVSEAVIDSEILLGAVMYQKKKYTRSQRSENVAGV